MVGDSMCPWGGGAHSVALDQVGGWFRFPSPPGGAGTGSGFVDRVSGSGA